MTYQLTNIAVPYDSSREKQILRELASVASFIWKKSDRTDHYAPTTLHRPGRYSYFGLTTKECISIKNDIVTTHSIEGTKHNPLVNFGNDPFDALSAALTAHLELLSKNSTEFASLPTWAGSAIGFVSYDTGRYLESIKGMTAHEEYPDAHLIIPRSSALVDHDEAIVHLISFDSNDNYLLTIKDKITNLKPLDIAKNSFKPLTSTTTKAEFESIVKTAIDYILAGDIFQVVLAQTLVSESTPNPIDIFFALCRDNPSPYHFLVPFDGSTLVGASPETMLMTTKLSSGTTKILMRPIAGTYPVKDSEDTLQLVSKLKSDAKENAEHIMLVDHARNDIGRVAELGSVHVESLSHIETYSKVHHIVSKVSGILEADATIFDALRSTFPIATLTGTPRIRAMEIIAELEGPSRGLFGGLVGIFGADNFLDSAVIIRSAIVNSTKTTIQAGAGIVADSNPEREYNECLWKAEAIKLALGS